MLRVGFKLLYPVHDGVSTIPVHTRARAPDATTELERFGTHERAGLFYTLGNFPARETAAVTGDRRVSTTCGELVCPKKKIK